MPELVVDKPFALAADAVATALSTVPADGLSTEDALRRRQICGPNRLRRRAARSALSILLHQFSGIIVWLLGAAVVLSLVLGDLAEAVAILVVLVINSAIGFFTELRAARSMEALLRIAEVR